MAFILLRLLVLGVIAAAADDVHITWLTPPRGIAPCVVAEAGRPQRRPPPPLEADDRPRAKPYRRRGEEDSSKQMSGEGSVEVTRKRNGTEGVYQCAVKRHGGVVLGYPAHWKFAYMDKQFTRQPENGTALAGQPYALSCEVPSAPPATVSWLKNDAILPHDDRIILVANQLLFTEVRKEDDGVYKCIATNSYLAKNRVSSQAWLQVEDPEESPPALLPLHDEVNVTAPRFSRVQLLCPVLGWPRPQITWEFTAPGLRTAILESTDEVQELTSLELDQEGTYKCSVDGHSHIFKIFTVTVTEPVSVILPPLSKEVVRVSTVRFNCTAAGRPAPNITWYKDGRPLVLGGRFNLRSSIVGNRYELVVGDVDSEDAGVFQCFANNGHSVASSWAVLSVTGSRADAPGNVRCWPLSARSVLVQWQQPNANVLAYTVQASKMQGSERQRSIPAGPRQPHTNTEETVTVDEALTLYGFQVRAYIRGSDRNLASDKSNLVSCQGQGVPIRISKLANDTVAVSWRDFALETPGVAQWVLQYRAENSTEETHIPLEPHVVNYTLHVSPKEPLQVRVLGSRSLEWLPQNLTYLPWTSTANQDEAGAPMTVTPSEVRVAKVGSRGFTVTWRCDSTLPYAFHVCVRKNDGSKKCFESFNNSVTVAGLEPDTEYEVEVQARHPGRPSGGPFSPPVAVSTLSEASERLKDLSWKYVNASAVRVSWRAAPGPYSVLFSSDLKAPLEHWPTVDTVANSALITGIDPPRTIFVFVKSFGEDPQAYSPMLTIPAHIQDTEDLQLQYSFTDEGVKVWWEGSGPRVVKYSQNLTLALDLWPSLTVSGSSVELLHLEPALRTYVMVAPPGAAPRSSSVLTVPPRPPPPDHLLLGVGIGVGAGALCVAAAAAALRLWRSRKRAAHAARSRRRRMSANEDDEEEAAEMKSVGGRLANGGGAKDAGEPLLNGHVHITENPQSKAPNGKMKKGCLPFDLSRFEDADATLETVLDADSSGYDLLDTSRPPDEPALAAAASFGKLPDDNMNSELTRSVSAFPTDNSKIQPTLQPNG